MIKQALVSSQPANKSVLFSCAVEGDKKGIALEQHLFLEHLADCICMRVVTEMTSMRVVPHQKK